MKSQDIVLLFKLVSIDQQGRSGSLAWDSSSSMPPWADWDPSEKGDEYQLLSQESRLSVRGLAAETGISKSEISLSLNRSYFSGLAKPERKNGFPRANAKALLEFVVHGLKYVYPARPAEVTRGITTGLVAPVFRGELMTAGELPPVWPDPRGKTRGQAVSPLYKSVTEAVRVDPLLYEYLALVDALRIGQPRERRLAERLLEERLLGSA